MECKEQLPWKIWYRRYDMKLSAFVDMGAYHKEYKRCGYAVKVAKEKYGHTNLEWRVSQENPWRRTCDICGAHYLIGGHFTGNNVSVVYYDNNSGLRKVFYVNDICTRCAKELISHLNNISSKGGSEE